MIRSLKLLVIAALVTTGSRESGATHLKPFVRCSALLLGVAAHGPTLAEPGFTPLAASRVPVAVAEAAAKVLELWTPGVHETILADSYPSRIVGAADSTTLDVRSRLLNRMRRAELRDCVRRATPSCAVSTRLGRGSAFVVRGNILITVFGEARLGLNARFRELAGEWRSWRSDSSRRDQIDREVLDFRANPMGQAKFFLTDAYGQVLLDSSAGGVRFLRYGGRTTFEGRVDLDREASAAVGMGGPGEPPQLSSEGGLGVAEDTVVLRLPIRLPSIAVAASGCEPGQRSYSAGYRAATSTRDRRSARDARDREVSIAEGYYLSPARAARSGRRGSRLQNWIASLRHPPVVSSRSDATPGPGGGVFLNGAGDACGTPAGFEPTFSFGPTLAEQLDGI